ncbi:hypothetical protein L0U85_00810 [Glycomyces sp. L485]|nr:TrmH family RNA methyltransferase [Glycomyces sp. L485]MCH7229409.1 hypothetical protein [Glycomyces sp. L485]
MGKQLRVSTRNARFQQWEALLANRKKRNQLGGFLVQGVRPIDMALEHGWEFLEILFDADRKPSAWAQGVLEACRADRYAVSRELMAELGEKDDEVPELLAVVSLPDLSLGSLEFGPNFLGVAFDRPGSPGNLGSLIRSADAFGSDLVITTGHGADPFDPRSVRASTGSLFSTRVAHVDRPQDVAAWLARQAGEPVRMVGTDEHGGGDLAECDLTLPTLLVIGREADGMSRAWKETVDTMVRIPIGGAASSLNAAAAGSIALYEAARQRSGRSLAVGQHLAGKRTPRLGQHLRPLPRGRLRRSPQGRLGLQHLDAQHVALDELLAVLPAGEEIPACGEQRHIRPVQPAGQDLGQFPWVLGVAEPFRDLLGLALDDGPRRVRERLRELGHVGARPRPQLGVVGQQRALGEARDHVQRLVARLLPALAAHEGGEQRLEPFDGQMHRLVVGLVRDRIGLPHAHEFGVVAEARQRRAVRVRECESIVVVHFGEDVGRQSENRLRQ